MAHKLTDEQYTALLAAPGPGGIDTVKEWFGEVLCALIRENEGFSGKRPLGDSAWSFELDEIADAHVPGCHGDEVWLEVIERLFAETGLVTKVA
ncbi:MAG: hypothetical protein JSS66_06730 [Armatimonadetes bacterium]|nr:hypothetical protein [Armatimonadota bacterium]